MRLFWLFDTRGWWSWCLDREKLERLWGVSLVSISTNTRNPKVLMWCDRTSAYALINIAKRLFKLIKLDGYPINQKIFMYIVPKAPIKLFRAWSITPTNVHDTCSENNSRALYTSRNLHVEKLFLALLSLCGKEQLFLNWNHIVLKQRLE